MFKYVGIVLSVLAITERKFFTIVMNRFISFFLLIFSTLIVLCGNDKTESVELHNFVANFYDSRYFINNPISYIDDSVKFENESSLFLSGYYSSVLSNNNNINPADSILSIKGHIRIDSLMGDVDIAVRCWNSSSRKYVNHIGEFHKMLSSVKPQQWQEFRLDIPVCTQMKEFDFEIKIKGAGCIWIGNLHADCIKYSLPAIYSHPAPNKCQQSIRYQPYMCRIQDLSAVQTENLIVLGKVWGLLKYFHPNVRNGSKDWDAELFRMIPLMMDADVAERNNLLLGWCNELGTFHLSNDIAVSDGNDAVRWIKDTSVLGHELSLALQRTVMADRTLYHKYLYQVPYVMSVVDNNEKKYPRMSFSDMNLKLLAVFRVWNYVQYFYPYRNLLDVSWDDALKMTVLAMYKADNEEEYGNVLSAMAVLTNDSHTCSAYMPKSLFKRLRMISKVPSGMQFAAPFITGKYHDGKYFVTWAFGESEQDLVRGDAIIAINGESVDDYVAREGYFLAASNELTRPRDLALSVSTSEDDCQTYTVIRNCDTLLLSPQMMPVKKFRRELYGSGIKESTMTWFDGRELNAFDTINDSVAYLHAEDMTADDFLKALEYKRIIVDLRNYPRNMYQLWLKSLLPDIRPVATVLYPDLLNPGVFHTMTSDMTGMGKFYDPERKIAVLVDERTQSAAEYAVMAMQSSPQVTVVGSMTAGADGNVVKLSLPGEYMFQVGGIGIQYPDGGQSQRCGIRIDCPIVETPDLNSDNVIEYALTILD